MSNFSGADFEFPQNLPKVTFADANPAAVLARLIKKYQGDSKKTLYPGDPESLLFKSVAYELSVALGLIDFTGKQNLLAEAVDDFLDQIGAFHGVERLTNTPSRTVQRIFAEPGLNFSVPLADTLRVTPDNKIFFRLTEGAAIPPAASATEMPHVDVIVECLTPGLIGNGFEPGQINVLVDPQPYVSLTMNISASSGGADIEDDDHYRRRIYLALEGYSTAGPEGAYQFWTYSASPLISDVAVLSPLPCDIEVYPLLAGGELPDQAMLDKVIENLSPRNRRPMGDRLTVKAPLETFFRVEGVYYISRADSGLVGSIQAAVQQAGADYAAWQGAKLGRDIVPDELYTRVRAAGAKRLMLTSPEFTAVPENAVARATEVSLTFGGFEDA
ncbi:MAG: baseplate J/gp47 family protein [Deltaproteobacteria bacterium]|jgi:phage-related baseplate assembly protein|nr:baseplate J/gp47 family protein [Deltaproteobacteria bacterium]